MNSHVCNRVGKHILALASMLISACGAGASADDGGISFGGSPHLLTGHDSVSMQSEVVRIDIHKQIINVDCKFVFHNSGPASTVRMGFPDEGQGAEEPYQGFPVPTHNLKAGFETYESYVDGKKVPTKLVPTNDRTLYWHTKTVIFKPKTDCIIRDVYTVKPGQQVTNENGAYTQTCYVLHTGASWHGPIGKAEIIVTIAPDAVPEPILLKPYSSLTEKNLQDLKWSLLPKGTVIYDGLGEPKLAGRTLTYVRSNFKPNNKDDVHLYYGWRVLTNMPN